MIYYKLTDENNRTRYDTQWGEGITHRATGTGSELCSADCIHVYDNPYKTILMSPIHADFHNPHLWECEVEGVVDDDVTKVGVKSCTTIRQIPLLELTTEQQVEIAIRCAMEVYNKPSWTDWANRWLDGTDRTYDSAYTAYRAAAYAAYHDAAYAAYHAAAYAAYHAAYAAYHAAYAAYHAAYAAAYAARAAKSVDINKIIMEVLAK